MGKFLLLAFMGVFLVVSVWWATWVWGSMNAELSTDGNIALTLGIVVSLVVGVGLMVLLFQSDRRGYDATVEFEHPDSTKS
ncbi:hypothetical protein sos41_02780 [Alphaproteobacteria bacterium SO-S41]|nr:hypothetical protein sos41_02780 [Alphaproteobacteria bacterium SO-S41]